MASLAVITWRAACYEWFHFHVNTLGKASSETFQLWQLRSTSSTYAKISKAQK